MGKKGKNMPRALINLGQNEFCISRKEGVESNQLAIKWLRFVAWFLQGMVPYQEASALDLFWQVGHSVAAIVRSDVVRKVRLKLKIKQNLILFKFN